MRGRSGAPASGVSAAKAQRWRRLLAACLSATVALVAGCDGAGARAGEAASTGPSATSTPTQAIAAEPDSVPATAAAAGVGAAAPGPHGPIVPVPGAPASFADLVEAVRPSVVSLYSAQVRTVPVAAAPWLPYGRHPVARRVEQSLGSGFLFDGAGHILTNAHVVDGAVALRIVFDDGQEADGSVVGIDRATDVAVVRANTDRPRPPLPLADSDAVRVGEWTIAVGNPFGLSSTVTAGIVSARSRRDVPMGGQMRFVDFLQTDTSINPGNSGGPLIDMQGRAIGVNTAVNREGQGIAFAIPMNLARDVAAALISDGTVARGWLGVFAGRVDADTAAALGLGETRGALVTRTVQGGPAEASGLLPGDVIVAFGDVAIASDEDLKWATSAARPGDTVAVDVIRGGAARRLDVVMGTLPE